MKIENKVLSEILSHKNSAEVDAEIRLKSALKNEAFRSAYLEMKEAEISMEDLAQKKEKVEQVLHSFGKTLSYFEPEYNCNICQDTGFANGKKCVCFENAIAKALTKDVGQSIDNSHTFAFSNFALFDDEQKTRTLFSKMEQWCDSFPNVKAKNILLSGPMGVGKTYLAESIANKLLDKNVNVSFFSAFALNNLFLQFHTTFDDSKFNFLSPLLSCDVLFIDDLGTEPKYKNVTEEYLYLIINERSVNSKSTVITTNLDLDGILSRYGARTFSRICNKSSSILLNISGSDLRLKKNK